MNVSITKKEEDRYHELCLMAIDFARHGNVDELEKMISHGFNPDFRDHKGNTLLMLASYNNQLDCTRMLINHGASVDLKNDRGQTPLAGVCFKGYFEIVRLLVENGANIDEDNGLGATPYTFAVAFGHYDIARYLMDKSKKKTFLKRISLKLISIFKK